MSQALPDSALDQAFRSARTFNRFTDRAVSDDTLKAIVDLMKWGPTAANSTPGRFVFVKSQEAKEKLRPCLSPGNLEKTMAAPVTVIVAMDSRFFEYSTVLFPAYDIRPGFEADPQLAATVALRNGSLQGAYFIVAARMLGLDCGPMSGFDNAKLDAAFFPDGRWKSNFLINLGYGDASGNYPRGPRLDFDTVAKIL